MNKRLEELENLAKGIESNVYASCLINIFPQDFDNIYWAIKTIKKQQELIESYGRVSEGMTEDYQNLEKLFEQQKEITVKEFIKATRYEQALKQIYDNSRKASIDEFMAYGYVAKQVLEGE